MVELEELLKIAGAPIDARTRDSLEISLQLARAECALSGIDRAKPLELLRQIDKSLAKTLTLLQTLEKHDGWHDICFQIYVSGDGAAVAVSPKGLFEGNLRLPRNPPSPKRRLRTLEADGTLIAVNARALLLDIQDEINRGVKPIKGQPPKADKAACVHYAENFFVHHSPHKVSTDPKSRFVEFCEYFYAAVVGAAAQPGAIAWHVRKSRHRRTGD